MSNSGFELRKMNKPFCIVYSETSRKGKYHFFDHRNNELAIYKKIPKNFLDKLLSYPITAFGYRFVDIKEPINPKFDRHDVIRTLDFWIEYWVYQNKCDYILEGTVNKDFELTVRELIETREVVLKCPADTQFTRNKIRVDTSKGGNNFDYEVTRNDIRFYYHYDGDENRVITNMNAYEISTAQNEIGKIFPTKRKKSLKPQWNDMIEFTENVVDSSNSSVSTVDQFCYKVVKMTYKEYINRGILYLPNATQADIDQLSRAFTGAAGIFAHNFTENFNDGPRFNFGGLEDEVSGRRMWGPRHSDGPTTRNFNNYPNTWTTSRNRNEMFWNVVDPNNRIIATGYTTQEDAQDYINEHILPSEVTPRPLEMGDDVVWDSNINRFRRATENDPISIFLSTETQSPELLSWVLTRTIVYPNNDDDGLITGDMLTIHGNTPDIILATGRTAEIIRPGDRITLNENGEWVKVSVPEPTD